MDWERLTNLLNLQNKLVMETRSECKPSQLGGLHQTHHRVTTSVLRVDLRPAEDSYMPTSTAGFCSAFHHVQLQLKLELLPQLL